VFMSGFKQIIIYTSSRCVNLPTPHFLSFISVKKCTKYSICILSEIELNSFPCNKNVPSVKFQEAQYRTKLYECSKY
jgi:hypothetical protein